MPPTDDHRPDDRPRGHEGPGAWTYHGSVTPGSDRTIERPIEIVPSVLPADLSGPDVIAACRPHVGVRFEAHLMVEQPEELAHRYVEAGCSTLIVHAEATRHLHRTLGHVRDLGAEAAVAINPATPPDAVAHVLDLCSMVLVMTVNPGFGGQDYIATMEPKIAAVRRMILDSGWDCDLEVDGGISPSTVEGAARAGANVLVAGSALFRDPRGLDHAVAELRQLARGTRPAPPAQGE
jgi:ribulose-phosphate 3-epimerase